MHGGARSEDHSPGLKTLLLFQQLLDVGLRSPWVPEGGCVCFCKLPSRVRQVLHRALDLLKVEVSLNDTNAVHVIKLPDASRDGLECYP
jgi:hypothetical protein